MAEFHAADCRLRLAAALRGTENGSGRSSLITLSFRLSDSRSHENKQRIMMADFKLIQVALFLAAVLQFSASSEGRELITREGERVALPCDSVLQDQPECEFTTWTVSKTKQAAKELVVLGKIDHDEEHRLEMKSCALVINKVTVEDVGLYTCWQFNDSKNPSQSAVFLSVVSITQEQSGNMEPICSVVTFGNCEFTVRWWFNGQKAVETPPSTCSAIFQKTSQTKGSYECEVTDGVNKKLFPFSPRASGDEPEETPAKLAPAKPAPAKPAPVKPAPEKTKPGKPAPEKTKPGKPAPGKPEPGKPAPGKPEPGKPVPEKPSPADEASSEPPELNVSKFTTLRQTEVSLFQLKTFLCGLFSREPGTSCFESRKETKSDAFRSSCQSGKELISVQTVGENDSVISKRLSDSRSHENKQRIMMVDFKWIQVALFLAAVLQFSAVSEGRQLITREGERVALPCDSVLPDQPGCEFTTWTVSGSGRETKELVQHGKIEPDEEHRLEMMKNCSLVIKKVTVKDVARYTCLQYRDSNDPPQSGVFLSVVSITQEQSGNMEINCSVRTYRGHRFTLRWWFNGQKDVEPPSSTCSAIFPKTSQTNGSYECEVTDGVNKKLFPFSPRASGDEPEETTTKPAPEKPPTTKPAPEKPSPADEASSEPPGPSALDYVMLSMRVVELVFITVITALLFRAQRNQEPAVLNPARKRRVMRSGPAASQANEDEDDGVVNYENSLTPRININ
ncbi:uncharacterized protein V6R79_023826 [Siganus canaliculatus]